MDAGGVDADALQREYEAGTSLTATDAASAQLRPLRPYAQSARTLPLVLGAVVHPAVFDPLCCNFPALQLLGLGFRVGETYSACYKSLVQHSNPSFDVPGDPCSERAPVPDSSRMGR